MAASLRSETHDKSAPWTVVPSAGEEPARDYVLRADSALPVAIVYGYDPDARKRHARLIAAAPDLLAALERFDRALEQKSYPELQGVWADAHAAIRKARGDA